MSLRLMQNELQQWGQWAETKSGGCAAYVSPSYTLLKLKMEQAVISNSCAITLSDDALLAIDNLVGMLKRSKPMLYQIIRMYYELGYTVQYMASQSGVSRPIIDKYLMAAETWLECKLESLCEQAVEGLQC